MAKIVALVRAAWLAAASYRLGIIMTLGSLLLGVVPVYFVAHALQPTMANVIRGEGTEYFGFLIVGMMVLGVVSSALYALPNAITAGTTDLAAPGVLAKLRRQVLDKLAADSPKYPALAIARALWEPQGA